MKMNKYDLTKAISQKIYNLSLEDIKQVVNECFLIMQDALESGRSVYIYKFGTFKPITRKPRTLRTPQGKLVNKPAQFTVKFKPKFKRYIDEASS